MTEYKKEDVEALILAATYCRNALVYQGNSGTIINNINVILDKFKPKPDKVTVLRNWLDRTESEIFFCTSFSITEGAWNQLRVYTTVEPAVEPAPEQYKMLDWDVVCQLGKHAIRNYKIPLNIDGMNWGLGEDVYRALTTFINKLSEGNKS